jgi:hypothetical protein
MPQSSNETVALGQIDHARFFVAIEWDPLRAGGLKESKRRRVQVQVTRNQLAEWLSKLLTEEAKAAILEGAHA